MSKREAIVEDPGRTERAANPREELALGAEIVRDLGPRAPDHSISMKPPSPYRTGREIRVLGIECAGEVRLGLLEDERAVHSHTTLTVPFDLGQLAREARVALDQVRRAAQRGITLHCRFGESLLDRHVRTTDRALDLRRVLGADLVEDLATNIFFFVYRCINTADT